MPKLMFYIISFLSALHKQKHKKIENLQKSSNNHVICGKNTGKAGMRFTIGRSLPRTKKDLSKVTALARGGRRDFLSIL